MSAYFVFVLGDIGVDLMQGTHAVELVQVKARLLCQIRTHILITDRWHP